ncbi:17266_t:CDS:2, partial [Cetraspora pellucida]
MSKREINYVEDSSLSLPYIEDNALSLGSLWDCNLSKTIGFNLFEKQLTSDHLIIHPLKKLDYRLIHVKSTEDQLTSLKIDGAISIEILSGILKVEGNYDNSFARNSNEEQLICEYNLDNYLVELLPKAKDAIDDIITSQLLEKKIRATHVVHGIILGAKVWADIRIRQHDTSKKMDANGYLIGDIPFGYVNASLKTSLKMLDSKTSNHDMQITVNSKPPIKNQPTTINQMFNLIENIDACVQKEQYYKFIGPDITGVPIRFNLVPISQFLDIKVEKLYKQLKDSILENFRTMLIALKDYQSHEYIKRCVLRTEYRLQRILYDSQSKLSKDITEYQNDLKKTTSHYFEQTYEALKKYKVGNCSYEDLFQIMRDYDESDFCIVKVYAKIEKFVSDGRNELNVVHEKDAALMNNLFKIVNALQKRKIEVGIALPSISNEFSLEIKDHNLSKIYSMTKIPQVLRILSAAVGMGNPIESRFYMLNASHLKIKLPLELKYFSELNNIISLLQIDYKVSIAHSYIDSLQKIRKSTHRDLQWKFFVALDAPDTALDAIYAIKHLPKELFSKIELIIGESSIPSLYAAPLLIVFYEGEIKAVCLDELDILILLQMLESKDFSILSCDSLRYSLYPDRSKFFFEFTKTVDRTKVLKLDQNTFEIPFNQSPDQSLSDALNVVRNALFGKDLDVISSIAQLAIMNNDKLITSLTEYGWSTADSKFNNKVLSAEGSKSLCAILHDWLKSSDPFLAKVKYARNTVEKVLNNFDDKDAQKNLSESVKLICNDPSCNREIKTNIEKRKSINDIGVRCDEYIRIFDQLSTEFDKKESFHVLNLISLLKTMQPLANKEFSDVLMDEIIPSYINRLPQYMDPYESRWDEIKEFMNRKSLPDLVSLLSKLNCDPQLYKLHEKLNKIRDINNRNDIKDLFELTVKDLTDEQKNYLWKNSRFGYLVRNAAIFMPLVPISTLFKSINIKEFPNYVPESIQNLLREYLKEHYEPENFSHNELNSIDHVIKYFDYLLKNHRIPSDILRKSIAKNEELERCLKSAGVLSDDNWDSKDKISKGWDQYTIELALEKLNKWKFEKQKDEPIVINSDYEFITNSSPETPDFKVLRIHKNWQPLMGEKIKIIMAKDYNRICKLIPAPNISEIQPEIRIEKILRYLRQKVKMWGCSALTATRIDCIACLLSTVDCTIARDILHTMAKFPMALPL